MGSGNKRINAEVSINPFSAKKVTNPTMKHIGYILDPACKAICPDPLSCFIPFTKYFLTVHSGIGKSMRRTGMKDR